MPDLQDPLTRAVAAHLDAEAVWSADQGGPVSDSEVRAVERELRVSLPRSYLAFLRLFGSARVGSHEVFGLPRNRLWGDVVLMNQLPHPTDPPHYVKVSRDRNGGDYYLATSQMNAEGECPVIQLAPPTGEIVVAASFLDFLHKARTGLL